MATILPFTGNEVKQILDGRLHSPTQDVVGDNWTIGSPLVMNAGQSYRFECNGNVRNKKYFPDHITNLWDTQNNITELGELLDTPQVVLNIRFIFDPSASAAGIMTIQPYVNETTPIAFKSVNVSYKANVSEVYGLITIYAGDELGFDIKNKNVYFEISASAAGVAYNPSIEIYRT